MKDCPHLSSPLQDQSYGRVADTQLLCESRPAPGKMLDNCFVCAAALFTKTLRNFNLVFSCHTIKYLMFTINLLKRLWHLCSGFVCYINLLAVEIVDDSSSAEPGGVEGVEDGRVHGGRIPRHPSTLATSARRSSNLKMVWRYTLVKHITVQKIVASIAATYIPWHPSAPLYWSLQSTTSVGMTSNLKTVWRHTLVKHIRV